MPHQTSTFLRRALMLDAGLTGATAILLVLGAGALAGPLGLQEGLLRAAGAVLVPFAAVVLWLATREYPQRPFVWIVIAANALWALDSVLIVVLDWVAPTTLGTIFVLGQAATVAVLAELQVVGLKRTVSFA